jgi:hypothetical protein
MLLPLSGWAHTDPVSSAIAMKDIILEVKRNNERATRLCEREDDKKDWKMSKGNHEWSRSDVLAMGLSHTCFIHRTNIWVKP